MLKQMREGAKSTLVKVVLFGLLLLAMIGLALIGGQNSFRDGIKDDTIASFSKVSGSGFWAWLRDSIRSLSAQSFDNLVQSNLRQQQMKQSDAYHSGLPGKVLRQEIDSRIFAAEADNSGIRADDVLAAKQIQEIIAPLVGKDGMTKADALQRVEQVYNVSEGQLVASVKSQIATDLLFKLVSSGVSVPQQMVDDALKLRNEYRRGEYFRLTAQNAGDIKTPTDAELKSYYDSIAAEYALPEYRTLSVIVLDKKSLGDTIKISDDILKQNYEDNIADYKTSESRLISQVVAPDEATAKLIYAAAQKSKDLQAANKTAGKNKGNYIKPQPYTEKDIANELSKAAFSAKAGEVVPPVQSPLGWHVLTVEKITPGFTKSFDSVKADIEKDLSQDKISEALYKNANKIDDEIAGGKTIAEVAKENNIPETVLQKIDAHGAGPDGKKENGVLPLFDKLVETGFSLKKGAASPLIETPDGAFAIVGVTDIFPSEQQSFEKVRASVLARWLADRQIKALGEKAAKIMDEIKKGGSFGQIAAALKQPVQMTGPIQRGADAAKLKLESNLITAIFSLDKPGQVTTVTNDSSITIVRLADRTIQVPAATAKKDSADMAAILERALKQDMLEQFHMSLMAKYNVQKNDKLLDLMYAPKDDNGTDTEE